MTIMKFSLAALAIDTKRHQTKSDDFGEIYTSLTGTGPAPEQLPAKRYRFDEKFAQAVGQACQLPESEIAQALDAIELPFPKIWVEGVRVGCRLRTGCMFRRDDDGLIDMRLVMENSVDEWKKFGWRLPAQPFKIGNRAIFNNPLHMKFDSDGVKWIGGDIDKRVDMTEAVHLAGFRGAAAKDVEADIRKNYTAADFMARALVLMRSTRIVDPAVFQETQEEQKARRQEMGQHKAAARAGSSASAPCRDIPYDVTAVARIATASGPRQVSALLHLVEIPIERSQPWISRKTGLPMLRRDGTPITTGPHKRKIAVSGNYEMRGRKLTASRPDSGRLEISDGHPTLHIGPR